MPLSNMLFFALVLGGFFAFTLTLIATSIYVALGEAPIPEPARETEPARRS